MDNYSGGSTCCSRWPAPELIFSCFHSKSSATEKKTAEQAKPQAAVFWPMDPYIVNLIDNEGERYLKVVLQLELSDQSSVEELNLIKPKS